LFINRKVLSLLCTIHDMKDYTRYKLQKILDTTPIEYSGGIIGIDHNNQDVYAFIDEDTLELLDIETKYHKEKKNVPKWQRTMVRNKLIDFKRNL